MQIKPTIRYHFIAIRMATIKKKKKRKITNVDKGVEKVEPLCIVGGNAKWYTYYGKQTSVPLKIFK